MANPIVGQQATISWTNGRVHQAVITGIVSGTTVNLLVGNDDPAVTWDDPSGSPGYITWIPIAGVAKGAGLGEWQDIATPDPVLAGALAAAFSDSTPTRALNANFTPSATRPVLCSYSGVWTGSLSLTGSQVGVIELRSDSAATPTTKRMDAQPQMSLGVAVALGSTIGIPWLLSYLCPANHPVRLVTSGAGTFALTSQVEAVL
jgi:hypothetical protein